MLKIAVPFICKDCPDKVPPARISPVAIIFCPLMSPLKLPPPATDKLPPMVAKPFTAKPLLTTAPLLNVAKPFAVIGPLKIEVAPNDASLATNKVSRNSAAPDTNNLLTSAAPEIFKAFPDSKPAFTLAATTPPALETEKTFLPAEFFPIIKLPNPCCVNKSAESELFTSIKVSP